MSAPLTRRSFAAIAGAAGLLAQTQPQAQPPPLPQNAQEELEAARDQIRRNAEIIAKTELPMVVEPAFQFKA